VHRPALVLADIPALAFDVAERLGVAGVALTNFSWDWIYADYAAALPAFAPLVARLRASYARAALLLRLPLHGDLSAFPCIRDVPLVARRATVAAREVRARLGLPARERLVLLSFGGLGLALPAVPPVPGVTFIITGDAPAGARALTHAQMTAAGVRYEDLVGAADAVMTKPGYGIVAECIANGTPMAYTARGRFAEYPVLVEGIEAHLPNAFISKADLRAGRWQAALEAVFAQPRRAATLRVDGTEVAADVLASMR
jgi:L-arabinokinase